MKMLHCLLLLLLLLLVVAVQGGDIQETTNNRTKRIFSLFSIVQFPNLACSSTSGTYGNGTCYTASECSAKSGTAQGNCAAGFGVCCIFSVSASGSEISQNCTYIVNPGYPSNYAPSSTPTTLTYTVKKCQDDICRLRLDYDLFVLTTPNTADAKTGQCDTDKMSISTTGQTVVPGTGTTGTYGNYPQLCGTNTGYHSYVDLSCTTTDEATISFTLGDSTSNQYKVKVTQYSCSSDCIASREGCFQYYTGVSGTIKSFNFANLAQLSTLDYKACIRPEAGYCCIEYTVISWAIGPTTCANAAANRCSGASTCSIDYLLIPGVINDSQKNYDRFCGVNANPVGFPASNLPLKTCQCPFEIGVVTHVTSLNGPAASTEDGFSIKYRQIPGDC